MKQLFSQCDPKWGPHPLGTNHPGTECQYGCLNCCFAMIANDSGHTCTPDTLCAIFNKKKIFTKDSTGTLDLLPFDALDKAFLNEYKSTHYDGFRKDVVKLAIPSPDSYIILWVSGAYSPLWNMNISTHFIIGWSADGTKIADPEGGIVRLLTAYGGPSAVKGTTLVKRLHTVPVVVTPAPAPLYTVRAQGLVPLTGLTFDKAVFTATAYAKTNVGIIAQVLDSKNQVVDTEFVVPAPGPIKIPDPVIPTSPPDNKQASYGLQDLLILLINFFLKATGRR